jgi:hypothetical protein
MIEEINLKIKIQLFKPDLIQIEIEYIENYFDINISQYMIPLKRKK